MPVTVLIQKLRPNQDTDIPYPTYMTEFAAGMDIYAAIQDQYMLLPGEIAIIPSGFALAIPEGFEIQIRPRSGIAAKYGVTLVNSPGTIDSDYRGEVKIPLINFGKSAYTIHRGDRIAQMILNKIYRIQFEPVDTINSTQRNHGGFGHTGT
ncbi:MAG: dUTP diphosphatase [Desulfobacterales bacterium]|nr:dUTP diphosphatase [Desulfobacterales bacterium]